MNRLNRRRFLALGAASTASVVLVACGNEKATDVDLSPTQIPDVAGAPPTLAPITSTPAADQGGQQQAGGGETGGAAQALTIKALDSLAFDPSEAEVSPGQKITLQNDGFLQHDLAVDEWGGVMVDLLNNGESGEFTVPEDATVGDTFTYYCTVPGHREGGMEGTFTIVEAGAAAPAQEATAEEGAAAGGATEALTIKALDSLAFDPSEADVSPGQKITLQNDGFLQHDIAVDEWGGALTDLLNNGETGEFTVPEDAAVGEQFTYYCTVAGHRQGGMEGTFTIVEAAAAPAGGAPAGEATAEEGAGATAEQGAATPGEAVTIKALDSLAFDPSELDVSPGQTITLQNDGFLQHDLAVDEWGGALTDLLNNGETAEFTIPDDAAVGEQFVYYCTVAGHRQGGMEGTFTIVEGGAAAPAAAAGQEEASPAAEGSPAAASDPSAVTVTATEWEFSPADFDVVPGGTITLVNEGTVAHGMTAEAFGGDFLGPVGAGQSAEFTVPSDAQPGDTIDYTAINSNAAGLGMGGTITIVEGEAGAAGSPAASPEAAGAADGGPLMIKALDSLSFDPSEADVYPGQVITLQNDGFLQHDLAVDEWGGALTDYLNNGQTAEFTVPEDAAVGEQFAYYCTVAGHRQGGMEGTFTIVEAPGGAAAGVAQDEASPAASPAASPEAAAAGGGSDLEPITIATLDTFRFDPSEVEVAPGQTIIVKNEGFLQHDLAVDEWGGALTDLLNNGQTGEFTIPDDVQEGEQYVFYCTVAGHRQGGMEGTFTIVSGGGSATASPVASPVASPKASPAAGGGGEALTIKTLDTFRFDPSEADVSPGQKIIVQNEGFLQHDLAVDEWGGALTDLLNNGQTGEFTVPEDAKVGDTFTYYCTVAGHRQGGMEGTFTIVE